MSETIEIEFEPAYEGVPDEKVEEAINDLRKRLKNFERGGVKATWKRKEVSYTPPGVYLINATGEMSALVNEHGEGDRNLLLEVLEEQTDLEVQE